MKPKILIIDDESIIRRALRRVLESEGYDVVEASNGTEGLKLWLNKGPNLVLLDVLMPGLSGLQVLEEVGELNKVKVILMSAYSGAHEVIEKPGVFFLKKPFANVFDVVKTVKEILYDSGKN